MPGLAIANFDCEGHYARKYTPGPHKALPAGVRRYLASLAGHLQVFLQPGDQLWAGASDELTTHSLEGFDRVLFWGQVDVSSDPPATPGHRLVEHDSTWADPPSWASQLWTNWPLANAPSEKTVAMCNNRALLCSDELRAVLPEISPPEASPSKASPVFRTLVYSMEELDEQLVTAPLGPGDGWVIKAPFSASGRERVIRHGRELSGEMRVRSQRLLQRYGQLLFESWLERDYDFGWVGILEDSLSKSRIFPPHELHNDAGGVFRGIKIDDGAVQVRLGADFVQQQERSAEAIASYLHRMGYRGAYGVDAFLYRHQGRLHLQPLCELNVRLSFGMIARAQADVLGRAVHRLSME